MHRLRSTAIFIVIFCAQVILQNLGMISPAVAEDNNNFPLITSEHYRAPIDTRLYTIIKGDTLEKIAKSYNLTVEGLANLNQERFFLNGFKKLKAGDLIYVPIVPVSQEMAEFIETGESRETTIRTLVPILNDYIDAGGKTRDLYSIAENYLINKANSTLGDFLNQYGTVRIQLDIDDDFSFKNSEFEMLLPLYDKSNHLAFAQTAIHRTDDRLQTNLGFGYRYFTQDYMIGGNAFLDYDVTRAHARLGIGGEYWRDYLKLSVNGYLGLTDFKISPDIEDYLERPANGFDVRAEAYLPNYPQLGMNVNFEQYFGDEVALFSKENRQKNPFAVTIGANYTPIPLVSFDANYRQGENGASDAEFGVKLNYRFGVSLKEQLDPNMVDEMRSLKGQRYDLVERNNNIILEYKKQELVFLYMVGGITGFYNETLLLGMTVKSKYAVENIQIFANDFLSAGGKIIHGNSLTDYSVTLPHYIFGGNNNYIVEAQASDVKGNLSRRAQTIVTVNMPEFDGVNSTFTPINNTMPADNKTSMDLKLTLMSAENTPYDIPPHELSYDVSGQKTAKIAENFKRIAAGVYTLTVIAGPQAETLTITPKIAGQNVNAANIMVIEGLENASVLDVSLVGLVTTKTANGENYFAYQAIVKDKKTGLAVPYATVEWHKNIGSEANFIDSNTSTPTTTSISNQDGIATIYLKSTKKAVTNIEVSANVVNDSNVKSADVVHFIGDISTARLNFALQNPEITEKIADGVNNFSYRALIMDSNGNPVPNIAISIKKTPDNDASLSNSSLTTDANGQASVTLQSTTTAVYNIVVSATTTTPNASMNASAVSFTAEPIPATGGANLSKFVIVPETLPANNTDTADITLTLKDKNGNPILNQTDNLDFKFSSPTAPISSFSINASTSTLTDVITVSNIIETSDGVYEATLKGKIAQIYTGIPHLNDSPIKDLSDTISLIADITTAKLALTLEDKINVKIADGINNFTFLASLIDAFGNPVKDIDIDFKKSPDNAAATLSDTKLKTDANGEAHVTLTSTINDVYNIVVSATTKTPNDSRNATPVSFTPDDKPAINGDKLSTFVITPKTIPADNVTTATIILTLKDKNGNLIPTYAPNLSFDFSPTTDITVSDIEEISTGVYQATIKGTKANSYIAIPKLNGSPIDGLTDTANLIADINTATLNFTLQDKYNLKIADGVNTYTYLATLIDALGNPVKDVEINFTKTPDDATTTLSDTSLKTDANGQASVTLKSTTNAVYNIVVSATTTTPKAIVDAADVSFTPDYKPAVDGDKLSTFVITPKTIPADNVTTATITLTLKDINGNLIPTYTPYLNFDFFETADITVSDIKETSIGVYEATIKGTKANTYTGIAEYNGSPIDGLTDTVNLIGDIKTATLNFTLQDKINLKIADGVNTYTYLATLIDALGNPVKDAEINFTKTVDDNDATLSDTSLKTDANGQAYVTLQSTTNAVYNIVVSATTTTSNGSINATPVSFTPDFTPAIDGDKLSTFVITPKTIPADNQTAATITLTLKDINGNLIPTFAPYLSFDFSPTTDITVSDISETSRGVYEATIKGTKATTYTGIPKLNGNPLAGLSDSVTLTADSKTAALTIALTDSTTIKTANSKDYFSYLATLQDKNGNVFANTTINLTKSPVESANFEKTSVITDANGQATIKLNSTNITVGNVMVFGTTTTPKTSANADKSVTFKNTIYIELTWNTDVDVTVNGDVATTIVTGQPHFVVRVKDGNGNLVKNAKVKLEIKSNGSGEPKIYPNAVTGDSNGVFAQQPAVSDKTQEQATVTATLISINGQTFNSPVPVTDQLFANFFAVTVNPGASTISASEPEIMADGTSQTTIIFTPRDNYGNLIVDIDPSSITSIISGINNSGIQLGPWQFVNNHFEAVMTAGTKAGSVKVIPSIDGTQAIASSSPPIVTLQPLVLAIVPSSIKAVSNQILANGKATALLHFQPRDKNGNIITTIDPTTISQNITSSTGAEAGVNVGNWSYDTLSQSYIATLTAGTVTGSLDIMPTINNQEAASIGVTNTLTLIKDNSTTNTLKIQATLSTANAIADGVATKTVTVQVSDSSGASVEGKQVTLTPQNSELFMYESNQSQTVTLDKTGTFTIPLTSTYASWLGSNVLNIESGGYNINQNIDFSLYVDQAQSDFILSKNVMYNDGKDSIIASFKPVDKMGRAIPKSVLSVNFYSTDKDKTGILTPNGFNATLTTTSSPSYYDLSVTMTNYTLWQPQKIQYEVQPISGVLLATLEVAPKLCALSTADVNTGANFNNCTPNDNIKYFHSGLGFVIKVNNSSPLWDRKMSLQSSEVDGELLLYSKGNTTPPSQNCSVDVNQGGAWMNDFGGSKTNHTIQLSFTGANNTQIDTYKDIGFKIDRDGGGGVGSCEVNGPFELKPQLVGNGNVKFVASTSNPQSTNSFRVPLTNERIDAGALPGVIVKIYSINN